MRHMLRVIGVGSRPDLVYPRMNCVVGCFQRKRVESGYSGAL